jgi:hypothetical protein
MQINEDLSPCINTLEDNLSDYIFIYRKIKRILSLANLTDDNEQHITYRWESWLTLTNQFFRFNSL